MQRLLKETAVREVIDCQIIKVDYHLIDVEVSQLINFRISITFRS